MDDIVLEFRSRYEIDPGDCRLSQECMARWTNDSGLQNGQLLDAIALHLASRFDSGRLEFRFCSVFIRRLKDSAFAEWPPLFWDVFIAFDAGEFYHDESRDGDPSETHSRPMIRAILDERRMSDNDGGPPD